MGNFKMYIFPLLKNQTWRWRTDSSREGGDCGLILSPSPSFGGSRHKDRAEGGRKNPEEKAVLGGKEGGAAGKDLGQASPRQGEVSLPRRPPLGPSPRGLHCSSALRDTASPWKAEVILPLQRAPVRPASPFPSTPWGLTFPGRAEAPLGPNTEMMT